MHTTAEEQAAYRLLDDIFLSTYTDKNSRVHNYTHLYSRLFHAIKDEPLKFLEIGIGYGLSAKGWAHYFKNAELYFIDQTYELVREFSPRYRCHQLDQGDPAQLEKFLAATGGNFDIIIDDGGHTSKQQITSFETLFPHLNKGGIYAIEDLCWCERLDHRAGERTTFDFLKTLLDEVQHKGRLSGIGGHLRIPKDVQQTLTFYQDQIDLLIVQNNIAIITRR